MTTPGVNPAGRRAVLVLGMHRSGTSALTRVLNLLGVDLGARLMPATPANRAGHWEHVDIVAVHEELLEQLGSSWDDPRPLSPDRLRGEEARPFRERIRAILERDFGRSSRWGLKDPRLCRLVPFWDSILRDFQSEPHFVIPSRHPDEVAASLRRRDGLPEDFSRILWLEHVLRAERETRGRPRSFVTYDALLESPRSCVAGLAEAIGLDAEPSLARVAGDVESFLNPALRNHRRDEAREPRAARSTLDRWVRATHDAVSRAVGSGSADLETRLDGVAGEFVEAQAVLAPWLDHLTTEALDARNAARPVKTNPARARAVPPASAATVSLGEKLDESRIPVTRDYETPEGDPRVSIVIPLFNRADLTVQCLESIVEHTPAGLFEVILVDNGSTDATPELLRNLEGNVKVVTNEQNRGFATACNQGARIASTDYVLFLNNDIEAKERWLEPLLEIVDRDPQVAAVGSKLLFPDGTIQHAGVAIAVDERGSHPLTPFHAYYQAPADDPRAGFPSYFQAVAAACVLVRRSAFDEAGGFDAEYWNGYEDIDLCFELQKARWRIVYQPESVLVYHESQSGPERFARSELNAALLNSRWLGRVEPDIVLDPDGSHRRTDANRIQPYVVPSARDAAAARLHPEVTTSIVILTRNGKRHTRQCLASLERCTPEPHEIIVVDNGSTDSTLEFLREYVSTHANVRVIANSSNRGFGAGNNQGLALARGGLVCLLNNDTVVTDGWLTRLKASLAAHPETGIVGPMTNYASGPQVIDDVPYKTPEELARFASERAEMHAGESDEARRLVAFCWLMRRDVLERIGGFDERFGLGNCEDDDYCLRAVQAGYRTRIARDVFVHHTGSQTFRAESIDYAESMKRNFELFKEKWRMDPATSVQDGYPFHRLAAGPPQPRVELPVHVGTHAEERGGRWLQIGSAAVPPRAASARLRVVVLGGEEVRPEVRRVLRRHGQRERLPTCETTAALRDHLQRPGLVLLLGPDVILGETALRELVRLARSDESIAAAGPTSNAGTVQQRVTPEYRNLGKGLRRFAATRARKYAGRSTDVPALGDFCLLLRAETVVAAGGLDAGLRVADALRDLCGRLRDRGDRVACAQGAFVHQPIEEPAPADQIPTAPART